MYRRILIAADPEGLSRDAASAVAVVAEPDAEVLIVSVCDLSKPNARRVAAEKALDHLFDEVRACHLHARLQHRDAPESHVAEEIAAAACASDADLVVIGSHRRGDLFTLFRGSVGHEVASRVSTPMMIVGTGAAGPVGGRRILVGVDGGCASREAVVTAAALVSPDTRVIVVHVDTPVGGLGRYAPSHEPTQTSPAGRWLIEENLAVLSAAGVHASGRQVYSVDGVAVALARLADELDADLIVVGSRRPGNLEAILLGSVSHDLIARTQRTVLLAATGIPAFAREVSTRTP